MSYNIEEYLPGQVSIIQQEFFSVVTLGATSVVGDQIYFGTNGGENNPITNFPIAGTIPKSYQAMLIWGLSYGFLEAHDAGDFMALIQDAYFVARVADKDYMRGKLGDLFDFGFVAQSNTGQIGTTGVALVAPQIVTGSSGTMRELSIPIPVKGLDAINISVHFNTDVAGFHNANSIFSISTILTRGVRG